MRLACVGSIKDDILNMEELSLWLIDYLREHYAGILSARYEVEEEGTAVDRKGQGMSEETGRTGLCQSSSGII